MTERLDITSGENSTNVQMYNVIAKGEQTKIYTKENDGFEATITFRLPTLKQKDMADILYSKAFNRMLQDREQLTNKELIEIAKSRGIWTGEDEAELYTIDDKIVAQKELYSKEKNEKKKAACLNLLQDLRDKKFRLAIRMGQITGTSIENVAEREKTFYMLLNCVFSVDDEGKETALYKNKEALDNEKDLVKLERILVDGRSFWTGEGLKDFLHLGD